MAFTASNDWVKFMGKLKVLIGVSTCTLQLSLSLDLGKPRIVMLVLILLLHGRPGIWAPDDG